MLTIYILLAVIALLVVVNIVVSYRASADKSAGLTQKVEALYRELGRIEATVKTEIAGNRKETFD
ncbi:MAG TPA: DNA recombination protein RmuC, partial [Segetibacter sp.]